MENDPPPQPPVEPRSFSQSPPAKPASVQSLFERLNHALASVAEASPTAVSPPDPSPSQVELASWLASLEIDDEIEDSPLQLRDDVFGATNTPPSLAHVASNLSSGSYKRILILTGAGVSVAAGIPDFRTPGTGLYDNLEKYNLPHPTAVFDVEFYQ